MAKVSAGDIRNGVTIEVDGKVCQVIDFMHVKPGKGAAFVRVKMKNIIDGGVVETTFRPTETFEQAHIERKKMQYLYNDGEFYNYMDNETFEQIMISADDAADSMKFVKENEEVSISFYQGNAFAIEPPLSVELVVTETEPGVKGNTATDIKGPYYCCAIFHTSEHHVPDGMNPLLLAMSVEHEIKDRLAPEMEESYVHISGKCTYDHRTGNGRNGSCIYRCL